MNQRPVILPTHSRLHPFVRGLLGGLALLLLSLAAVWVWAGSEGSLDTALRGVSALLPKGQTLSAQGVQGRLRGGGVHSARIGQVIYTAPGLRVQAEQVTLSLDGAQLWQGRWPMTRLQIGHVQVQDQRPATPSLPPVQWTLPLDVKLDWQLDRLDWQGTPAFQLTQLQGSYSYQAQMHQLKLHSLEFAQGRYSGQASLQAVQPMALQVELNGQVQTPQTGRMAAVPVQAQLRLQGDVGPADTALQLTANLTPQFAPRVDTQAPAASAMQAQVSAQIRPWQTQVVTHAQGQWGGVDLARLWPGAPSTLLDGALTASLSATESASPRWQGQLHLNNQRPGPWDRQLLPIQSLQAQVSRFNSLWQVDGLQARIGSGQVQGQGRETAQGWVGQLQLDQVLPAQLFTGLPGPAWRGQIQAQALPHGAVQVQANMAAAASMRKPPGQASLLQFKGQWQAGEWAVQQLDLRLADAVLSGQGRIHTTGPVLQGQVQLAWPGMNLQLSGEAAPTRGQGQMQMAVTDAASAAAWLQRWPVGANWLHGAQMTGQAALSGQWQGGWQHKDSQLSIDWKAPALKFQTTPTALPVQLTLAQGQVRGTLADLQTHWQGQVQQGPWLAQVNSRLSLVTPWGARSPSWQGQLQALELELKHARQEGRWQLQLPQAVDWRYSPASQAATLTWQGGAVQLRGPTPGVAQLRWSAGQWALAPRGGLPVPDALQLQINEVPLRWAQALGASDLLGDVMLQGRVDVKSSQPLALSAVLERSRGDLLLPLEGANQPLVPAGLREARARLNITGAEAKVDMSWDSEQLGQLSAQGQTQITDKGEWLATAPIAGQVKSSLRRVGLWSLLAPPGWRVQGTLDTTFEFSGTRSQPRWQGTLAADQLTVRSAVQGIEFSQGQLRARLQDQQVQLTQLSFKGEGAQGGQLQAQGALSWLPSNPSTPMPMPSLQQVRIALKLQAQGLRVSNRADRRLAISGAVDAQLDQGRLRLKGRVQADQALFILPENTTPTLGDDVVVRRRGAAANVAVPGVAQPSAMPSWVGVPEVQLVLDLGPDFQVQGQGLQTRLAGVLNLSSSAATQGTVRLSGDVRTDGGRYKAYGQALNIESGLLRFNGAFNNPDLDIVAIRPNLSQRVGVSVGGTALQPRIQLFSDPDLPDAEKLAWLVLGRSGADGGAESAMLQQAAVTFLSRDGKGVATQLAGALGLDEISLGRGSRGDSTATGTAISLGKRLSRDFYLVYESSLSGTFGSLYMFYDLSRRFKLRAQTGDQNAVDVIFTVRKD